MTEFSKNRSKHAQKMTILSEKGVFLSGLCLPVLVI